MFSFEEVLEKVKQLLIDVEVIKKRLSELEATAQAKNEVAEEDQEDK